MRKGQTRTAARIGMLGTLLLLAVAALYVWWQWPRWRHKADIASGFAARVACSCREVEGRPLSQCKDDLRGLEGMWLVQLSERPEAKAVDAGIPLLANRTARFAPGYGCLIEPSDSRVATSTAR